MSGRTTQTEQVDVVVAAKDLPVGTFLTKEEMKTAVKRKKMPKDGLPPAYVQDESELMDKRLARGIRAEETFNPKDLTKGGVVTLPPGMNMVALQIGVSQAVAGFVGPGSRVDVLATLRLGNRLMAFPMMVNMLVLAVDTNTAYTEQGTFPSISTVSFAVDRRQALLLALAKSRGCTVELMLRNPEAKTDETYSIEKVERLLQDSRDSADIIDEFTDAKKTEKVEKTEKVTPKPGPETTPAPPVEVDPVKPNVEVVKVPVATESIKPGTKLTNDLINDSFKEKEFRKGDVELALSLDDLRKLAADGKELVSGLGKGQYVTGEVIGEPGFKTTPRVVFDPKDVPQPEAAPVVPAAPAGPKRRTHETILHTSSGSRVFVYEEVRPGEWRMVGGKPLIARPDDDHEPAPKAAN